MSIEERKTILESIKYIDEILLYDTEADLFKILSENKLNIDIRILGAEYKNKSFTGRDLPLPVYFNFPRSRLFHDRIAEEVYEAEYERMVPKWPCCDMRIGKWITHWRAPSSGTYCGSTT